MKAISLLFLFIGIVLIIQAYYSNNSKCPEQKVEIRYIPRTLYEDQLSDSNNLTSFYKSMFEDTQPLLYKK